MRLNFVHKELAGGGWQKLSFAEQMANIGSEVLRAIKWRKAGDTEESKNAGYRALELLYLTIDDPKNHGNRLGEVTRLNECVVDDFFGDNIYKSSDLLWNHYFMAWTYAAQITRGRIGV